MYNETHSYTTGCYVDNLYQELAGSNRAIAEKAEYLVHQDTTALSRCIRKALDAGEVDGKDDPARLAEAIINSCQGAKLRMKSSRSIQPLNAFLGMLEILLR